MCHKNDILCKKCIASANNNPNKVHLKTAKRYLKKRYYNHKMCFKNRHRENSNTLHKCVLEMQSKYNENPVLKSFIVKRVKNYEKVAAMSSRKI